MGKKLPIIFQLFKEKIFVSTILGNSLDHYDTALYGFLAPYIAPLFFPHQEPVTALIFTYSLMSASIITRPLGALFFGKLANAKGGKQAFILSLWGVAITTGGMGVLPTYDKVGFLAPLSLLFLRACQAFFASGESIVAPLFMLKNISLRAQGQANGLYQSSTVFGILLASLATTLVSFSSNSQLYWRVPFVLSFLTGVVGLLLRYQVQQKVLNEKPYEVGFLKAFKILLKHKQVLLKIVAVSSLSYVTYAIPFVFINIFVVHVSSVSLQDTFTFNTALLALDMCLLPFFGKLSDVFGVQKIMIIMATSLAITVVPIFLLVPNSNPLSIFLMRIWIVLCGLGFSAPLHIWFAQILKGREHYLLTGVGYALGSELFGRSTPSICLWLWHTTNWVVAPAFYIIAVSISAIISLQTKSNLVSQNLNEG